MKESKSATTIRRRTVKPISGKFDRLRQPSQFSSVSSDTACDADNSSYLLDDDFLGKTVIKNLMSHEHTIFLSLISLRIVNALFLQTYFVPDEYWQSTEVAHSVVFRYGYLTWEWQKALRGFTYPGIFAVVFKLLSLLHLDYRILIIKVPHLIQAFIAAYGDLHFYKLCRKLSSQAVAEWSLLCHVLSWFTLYVSCRTLTNSTEMVCVVVALYHYPWSGNIRGSWKFIVSAAVAVVIRPTSAVTFVLLSAWHFQRNMTNCIRLFFLYFCIGCAVLMTSLSIDRLFYGYWALVQYNFMQFNVVSGLGSFYGTHPWHWYITQGLPAILFSHIYLFIRGTYMSNNKVPLVIILWNIVFYSFLGHKEFRFLYPILPLCMFYCGVYLDHLTSNHKDISKLEQESNISVEFEQLHDNCPTTDSDTKDGQQRVDQHSDDYKVEAQTKGSHEKKPLYAQLSQIESDTIQSQIASIKHNLWKSKLIVSILVLLNIPTALYFCLVHQRGTISVMHYLARQADVTDNMNVLFLMPCHSTPYYSYIHRNITMRFLTCEPNFQLNSSYLDEADIFYSDPLFWLRKEIFNKSFLESSKPTHIVTFDNLNNSVTTFFMHHKYKKCQKFFHTQVTQGKVGKYVTLYCLS